MIPIWLRGLPLAAWILATLLFLFAIRLYSRQIKALKVHIAFLEDELRKAKLEVKISQDKATQLRHMQVKYHDLLKACAAHEAKAWKERYRGLCETLNDAAHAVLEYRQSVIDEQVQQQDERETP